MLCTHLDFGNEGPVSCISLGTINTGTGAPSSSALTVFLVRVMLCFQTVVSLHRQERDKLISGQLTFLDGRGRILGLYPMLGGESLYKVEEEVTALFKRAVRNSSHDALPSVIYQRVIVLSCYTEANLIRLVVSA